VRFVYDGTKYEIEPHRLTFGEARAFEKASGHTMSEMATAGGLQDVGAVQALFWIAMRREDKDLRFSDLDDMNMGDFEQLPDDEAAGDEAVEGEPAGPTPAGDEPEEHSTPSG